MDTIPAQSNIRRIGKDGRKVPSTQDSRRATKLSKKHKEKNRERKKEIDVSEMCKKAIY
jgi:hypothetical protein